MATGKRIKRAVIGLGVAAGLASAGWYVLLPVVIRGAVTQAFESLGYAGAAVEVGRINFQEARLHNLRVTERLDLHVAEIRVHYRLRDVLRKRVDRVAIDHLTLRLPKAFRPPSRPAYAPSESGERLPFNRVDFRNAVIEIEQASPFHHMDLPTVELTQSGQGALHLAAHLLVHDTPVEVDAIVNTRSPSIAARAFISKLDLAPWAEGLGALIPEVSMQGKGNAQLTLNLVWGEERSVRIGITGEEPQLKMQKDELVLETGWHSLALVLNGSSHHPGMFTGRMACEGLRLHALPADIRLSHIAGAIPLYGKATRPETPEDFSLQVGRMQGRGLNLSDIEAKLVVVDRKLDFEVSVPLYAEGVLLASGDINADGDFHLINLALPAVSITDPAALGQRLTAMADLQISGTPAIREGRVRFDGRMHEAHAEIDLNRISVKSKKWDFNLQDFTAALRVEQAGPLLTPEVQEIRVASLKLGELQLQDGRIRFTAYTNGVVHVELVEFNWGMGKLIGRDFELKPGMTALDMRLEFEHIELDSLLRLAAAGKAEGSGSLSGYWNIGLAWSPTLELHLGKGWLDADPGGGWFKVSDAETAAQLVKLGGSDAANTELMHKIQQAVYDFQYDVLQINLASQPQGGIITRIHAEGEGPRGDQALRFGALDFNIDGLDDLLQIMLIRSEEMRREMEAGVNEALKRYLGGPEQAASDEAAEKAIEEAIDNFF